MTESPGRSCLACGQFKPWGEFGIKGKGGSRRMSRCKPCSNAAWKAAHPRHRPRPELTARRRVCFGCKVDKPWSEFALAPRQKSGHKPRCKACLNAQYKPIPSKTRKDGQKKCARCEAWKPDSDFRLVVRGALGMVPDTYCIECTRARGREWQRAHPEYRKRYYAANVTRQKEWHKEYTNANKARYALYAQKRRALKMAATTEPVTVEAIAELYETFGHACAYCLKTGIELTMDHAIPLSKGGPHHIDNIVPACKSCNSVKHDRSIFAMLNR